MKVKEMVDALQKLDDDADVFIVIPTKGEYGWWDFEIERDPTNMLIRVTEAIEI